MCAWTNLQDKGDYYTSQANANHKNKLINKQKFYKARMQFENTVQ